MTTSNLQPLLTTTKPAGKGSARSPRRTQVAADKKWSNLLGSADEQYQLKKHAVIAEASRAFGHKGYQNVSLADIAKTLNVTKAALYYYFQNKQELLYECHCLCMDIGDRVLDQAIVSGSSGMDAIRIFIEKYVEALTDELGASSVLHEIDAMRPEDIKQILRRRRVFDTRLRALIDKGIADKSIRPCNAKLAVFWFMGAINGIPRWYSPSGELSGVDIAEAFVNFLGQGISNSV